MMLAFLAITFEVKSNLPLATLRQVSFVKYCYGLHFFIWRSWNDLDCYLTSQETFLLLNGASFIIDRVNII